MGFHNLIPYAVNKNLNGRYIKNSAVLMLGDFNTKEVYPSLKIIRDKMESLNCDPETLGRVCHICSRIINNISEHGSFNGATAAYLSLSLENNYINIRSGNIANKQQRQNITDKLSAFCTIKKDELLQFYAEVLKETLLFTPGSNGLGLFEIVCACEQALSYNFEDLGNGTYYFELNVVLKTINTPQA